MTRKDGTSDVVILGGGPAGCTTALVLARAGLSVCLIERTDNAGWKVGESLPPAAKPLLQDLGLWQRFTEDGHTPCYGNRSAWGSSQLEDYDFIRDPQGTGWHLDRRRFNHLLTCAAVEAGATRCCPARLSQCRPAPQGDWQLQIVSEGETTHIATEFMVDASGRAGWFARCQGVPRQYYDRLVGIVGVFCATSTKGAFSDTEADHDSLTLIEAAPDGWWYAGLVPDSRLVVAYMTDADLNSSAAVLLIPSWLERLHQTTHIRERIRRYAYHLSVSPHVISANSSRLTQMTGGRWLAVGDAAAAHDPLSSQGILTALATGLLAAQTIQRHRAGDPVALENYNQHLQRAYDRYLVQRAAYYELEQRWPSSPFWRRRLRIPSSTRHSPHRFNLPETNI
ncbi:MAG: NAD(P)/FAD-dependent oxidoreductase [Armatimonadota bacterium]|nr:NAD(P)/FAD-dependent oxidoreductase [Armatimonadota bacterium]